MRIVAEFEVVTPIFLGGADPNEEAELRPPSIKGALRWWYRAVDPNYKDKISNSLKPKHLQKEVITWEEYIFGGNTWGQSPATLNVTPILSGNTELIKSDYKKYNRHGRINGINYLGYSLSLGDNRRLGIYPGNPNFTISVDFKKTPIKDIEAIEKTVKAWVSAIWLLGNLGGLGTRSRRGFGSLHLKQLKLHYSEKEEKNPIVNSINDEISKLKVLNAIKHNEWHDQIFAGLDLMINWFGEYNGENYKHTVITKITDFVLLPTKSRWDDALNEAGEVFQRFRSKYKPDYDSLKGWLKNPNKPEIDAPRRVKFGLPITIRYNSLKNVTPDNFVQLTGETQERSASRLIIRVVKLSDGNFAPLFFDMQGPLLSENEKIKAQVRSGTYEMKVPAVDIIKEFLDSL